jgi:phosphate transport system substrate-binding protein
MAIRVTPAAITPPARTITCWCAVWRKIPKPWVISVSPTTEALEIAGPRGAWLPSVNNVQRERYQPLSRPLFVYVNDKDLRERPEVRRFITFTVQRGLRFTEQAGAIPLPKDTYRIVESKLYRHLLGTSFGGDLPIGLTISQAIRRSFAEIRSTSPR